GRAVPPDGVALLDGGRRSRWSETFVSILGGNGLRHRKPGEYCYSAAPRSSSSPGNSLTEGYFMISLRAIFQAFCTIQESDRSCRVASSWISFSMSSGK